LEDKVVNWPKRILGKRVGAKPVLVAYHHESEVKVLAYERQIAKHAPRKAQFVKAVYLLVGRLFDKRTVAVDKKNALLFH
jgi:hypothetical protein